MTEDLGQIHNARGVDQDGLDSDSLSGGQDAATLIGQAAITVAQPAPGQDLSIDAEAGQRYVIEFSPDAAQVRVQGNDLILTFADGGSVTFENLGTAASQPDAPVFEIAGQPISSTVIFGQAVALAEGEEAPTFETAAAPNVLVGTGETRYDDDTGDLIDLIDPQGVIPGTELEFRLIDLEPTDVLLDEEEVSNPPVDFDVDVTANFIESLDAAGLTFADGVGFGGGGGSTQTFGFTDVGGEDLGLEDDETQVVDLSFVFPFLGVDYTSITVSSNGFVWLGNTETDNDCCDADDSEFLGDPPRIAPAWYDLDPGESGASITVADLGDSIVITWQSVPEFSNDDGNTFQVQLFEDGRVVFSYETLNADLSDGHFHDAIIGITAGDGASDPGESDLSPFGSFNTGGEGTVYEFFERDETDGADNFDLSGQTIVFTPNGSGGWEVTTGSSSGTVVVTGDGGGGGFGDFTAFAIVDGNDTETSPDLVRINLQTGAQQFVGTIDGGEGDYEALTFGQGADAGVLFAFDEDGQRILKIDPATADVLAVWESDDNFDLDDPGMTVNSEGRFFILDERSGGSPGGSLFEITFNGLNGGTFDVEARSNPFDDGDGSSFQPSALAADPNDPNVFYAFGEFSSFESNGSSETGFEVSSLRLAKITLDGSGDPNLTQIEISPNSIEQINGIDLIDADFGLSFAPDGGLWLMIEDLNTSGEFGSPSGFVQLNLDSGTALSDTFQVLDTGATDFEQIAIAPQAPQAEPEADLPGGFLYEFQVGEAEIVADNIHGTDVEDGVTRQFTITTLPTGPDGTPVGFLLIDRGDDNVIEEIVGPGFSGVPIVVQTGDSVFYFLPKSDFADRPDTVTFNYFTVDSDGLNSLGDGPATVTINLPDPVPTVTAEDVSVDEDDIVPLDNEDSDQTAASAFTATLISSFGQQPGSDTLELGLPFDKPGFEDTIVTGTISADFGFDNPGTIGFTQATIDALEALNLTSSTNDLPLEYEVGFDGLALLATAGDEVVFAAVILPPSSSGDFVYGFGLFGSINHPLTDDPATGDIETKFEDPSVVPILFQVTDLNGDTATGAFNVTVVDDVPTIGFDGESQYYSDGELLGSLKLWESDIDERGQEPATAHETFTVVYGADGPESDSEAAPYLALGFLGARGLAEGPGTETEIVYDTDGSTSNPALTSGGETVTVAGDPNDPTVIYGFIDGGEGNGIFDDGDVLVFKGSVDVSGSSDSDNGHLWFELYQQLDHPDVDEVMEDDNIRFEFSVTVTDDDGDSDTLNFSVDVDDDGPRIFGPGFSSLDEDGLTGGITGGPTDLIVPDHDGDGNEATNIGRLQYEFGQDGPGDVDFALLDGEPMQAQGPGDPVDIFSHGDAVTFAWDGATRTLTGLANAGEEGERVVFELEITDISTGAYSVRLLDSLDHPAANTEDTFSLLLPFTVSDFDGDTVTGQLTLLINDDSPTIADETAGMIQETTDGAPIPGDGTGGGTGEPEPVQIVSLVGDEDNLGGQVFAGEFGDEFRGPFDARSPAEAAATDGSQFTDSALHGAGGTVVPGGVQFLHTFSVPDGFTIISAKLVMGMGGVQGSAGRLGADPIFIDGVELVPQATLTSQSGFDFDVFEYDIPAALFASLLDGSVNVTVDVKGSAGPEQAVFDFSKIVIDGTVPGAGDGGTPIPGGETSVGDVVLTGQMDVDFGADGPGMFTGLEFVEAVDPDGATGDTDGTAFDGTLRAGGQVVAFGPAEEVTDGADTFLVLTGTIDGGTTDVIEVTLNKATGDYEITLLHALDHPDQGPAGAGSATEIGAFDPLNLVFQVTVTDFDGDSASSKLTVTIKDDGPTQIGEAEMGVVEEEHLALGNEDTTAVPNLDGDTLDPANFNVTTTVTSGSVAGLVDFGADGPSANPFALSPITSGLPSLTSQGAAVAYDVTGDTLTGYVDSGLVAGELDGDDREVFTLELQSNGDYTFTLLDQLDHPVAGVEDILPIDFSSVVLATDYDGDSISLSQGTFTIKVIDDVPVENGETEMGTVEEEELKGGNEDTFPAEDLDILDPDGPGPLTDNFALTTEATSGSVAGLVSFGADRPGSFGLSPITDGLPADLTSQGGTLVYDVTGSTLTAYVESGAAGGLDGEDRQVFTLELQSNGDYTFTLLDQLDHPVVDVEDILAIDFSSVVVATDFDGDSITLSPGVFTIKVIDDTPLIFDGAEGMTVTHDETPGIDFDADDTNNPRPAGLAAAIALLGLVEIGSAQSEVPVVSVRFGADEPGGLSLTDNAGALLDGVDSGLQRSSDDLSIFLFTDETDPRLVHGRAGTDALDAADGETVFLVFIDDADSTLWVTQFDAVEHLIAGDNPLTDHDDTVSVSDAIFVTATDFDGDTATTQEAVTVAFQDDGPSVVSIEMINDETLGLGDATPSDDLDLAVATLPPAITGLGVVAPVINASSKQIDFDYGADGPGGIALNDVVNGQPSGLVDTQTGRGIFLFNGAADTVVGVVVPEGVDPDVPAEFDPWVASIDLIGNPGSIAGLDVAFASVMGDPAAPSGPDNASSADLVFVQYRAIQHDNPHDHDEANPEPNGASPTVSDIIDFENLDAGAYDGTDGAIDGTFAVTSAGGHTILVSGFNPLFGAGTNAAVIFDTANPPVGFETFGSTNQDFGGPGVDNDGDPNTGGNAGSPFQNDTPLNNVLLVARDLTDNNPADGLVDVPAVVGNQDLITQSYDFSQVGGGTVSLESLDILDVDREEKPARIDLFDENDILIASFILPRTGDNGVANIKFGDFSGVARMEVILHGSGAIDNIRFHPDTHSFEDEFVTLGYTVTDADGDTAKAAATITIEDDGPTANNDAPVYIDGAEGGSASGNVFGNDEIGVDGIVDGGPVILFSFLGDDGFGNEIEFTAAAGSTVTTFAGGELTVNADGAWEYFSGGGDGISEAGYVDDFSYIIQDGDGDTDSAIQPIRVVLEPDILAIESAAGVIEGDEFDDFLSGSDNNNSIFGNDGNDLLFGGGGNDLLFGGGGIDQMYGDGGEDTFVVRETGNPLSLGDIIADFEDGTDVIGLVAGELSFSDLTIADNGGGDAVVSITATTEILVTVENINASLLDENDFTTIV